MLHNINYSYIKRMILKRIYMTHRWNVDTKDILIE